MTGKQQSDDMMPDAFKPSAEEVARKQAERDALVEALMTPMHQPKKLPSEKLYTQCGNCGGTARYGR